MLRLPAKVAQHVSPCSSSPLANESLSVKLRACRGIFLVQPCLLFSGFLFLKVFIRDSEKNHENNGVSQKILDNTPTFIGQRHVFWDTQYCLKINCTTKYYRQTGWLGTCGMNRDRVPQSRGKETLVLPISWYPKMKEMFYLHLSRLGNSVPIRPTCPESPCLMVIQSINQNYLSNFAGLNKEWTVSILSWRFSNISTSVESLHLSSKAVV